MKTAFDHPFTPATNRAGIPAQWAWHHQALLQVHARIRREREERGAALRTALERGGADLGDSAIEEREHAELLVALSTEEAEIAEVEAAIDRIRNGTYGVCVVTGRAIALARLRAVPWTRFSQEAAETRERSHLAARH